MADAPNTLGMLAFPPGVGFPYPRDVLVGPDGRIVSIRNSFPLDELEATIDDLLPR